MQIEAQYVGALINRHQSSELNKVNTKVLAYEVPILAAMYGRGNIEVSSLKDIPEHRRRVDPDTEYRRLTKRYGVDSTGATWVSVVYGQVFDTRLQEAIAKGGALVNAPLIQGDNDAQPEDAADPLD